MLEDTRRGAARHLEALRGETVPRPNRDQAAPAASLRELVIRFNLWGVGVDLVKDDNGQYWAVDVNLAAGYRDTGLEPALTNSVTASLPSE